MAESASLISEHNIHYSHADINTANFEIIDKKKSNIDNSLIIDKSISVTWTIAQEWLAEKYRKWLGEWYKSVSQNSLRASEEKIKTDSKV